MPENAKSLLTVHWKRARIDHKFILTAMKKRSICGGFSESRRLVRGGSAKQRRALWSSMHKRGLMHPVSVNEGGTAEDTMAFVPCFYGKGWELFLFVRNIS